MFQMKVNILHKLELVLISFIQLFLIAINTYFLTFRISIGVIFASIFIFALASCRPEEEEKAPLSSSSGLQAANAKVKIEAKTSSLNVFTGLCIVSKM